MCFGLCLYAIGMASARAGPLNVSLIEQITGLPGVLDARQNVFKITIPRHDMPVYVGCQPLLPFMGLNSWAAFAAGKNGNDMVTGDMALFQDEVNPALNAALTNGLSVTALNSRFLFDEPNVYFMHLSGRGDLRELACGIKKVLGAVTHTRTANPYLAISFGGLPPPERNAIKGQIIENILDVKGQASNGMFKVVIGCTATMSGIKIGSDMGADSWAVFTGVDDNATMEGDIAVREAQLQSVLKALCRGGINITAINNHLAGETPRLIFVSYWGKGYVKKLTETLKAALDAESE